MKLLRYDFFGPAGTVHLSIAALFAIGSTLHIAKAAEFALMPNPQTVHIGHFAANVKPVLSIDSGDTVTIETSALLPPEIVDQSGVVPPSAVPQYQRDIFREVKDRGPGPHVLTGPIEIKGAMPGDVLEVRILEINLALDWGFNRQRPYTGTLPDEFTALESDHPDQSPDQDSASRARCRCTGR